MVGLVKHASGRKVVHVQFEFLPRNIASPDDHPSVAFDLLIQSRKRKASLVADLLALNMNYLRVDECMLLRWAVLARNVHHEDPFRDPNLRSRKPDSACLIHQGKHPIDQYLKLTAKTFLANGFCDR